LKSIRRQPLTSSTSSLPGLSSPISASKTVTFDIAYIGSQFASPMNTFNDPDLDKKHWKSSLHIRCIISTVKGKFQPDDHIHQCLRCSTKLEAKGAFWTNLFTLNLPLELSRDKSELDYLQRTIKEGIEAKAADSLQHINQCLAELDIDGRSDNPAMEE
jgi:hypothetical protein